MTSYKRCSTFLSGMIYGAIFCGLVLALVVLFSGCAAPHQHIHKQPTMKPWKPGPRCKIIGQERTSNIAVIIERNCMKNGVTTISMVVLNNKKNGTVAATDGARLIKKILGYKPTMAVLLYGKAKGLPFFLCIVTGGSENTD